jgi:L,D-transpeptidase ErfK/SrfK
MSPMRILLVVSSALFATELRAEIYELPPDGYDVVGAVATVTAREEDTLIDIARRNGLGYHDIVRANPDVNVWVPGEGTEVVLPTRFVLPPGPRRGIVLNLAEYRLYYYPEPVEGEPAYVMTYPISIGRMDWETPLGSTSVISKVTDPSWYPPQSVRDEHEADGRPLPRVVPPGPDNPLGRYAMRLGLPGYLIHSTNRPAGVGMRVTHGCIRMFPEDIEYLFPNVDVNTPVRIINTPVKIGWFGDELVLEVHPVLEAVVSEGDEELIAADIDVDTGDVTADENEVAASPKDPLTYVTEQFIAVTGSRAGKLDWDEVEILINRSDGIPAAAGTGIKNAAASAASQ